MTWIEHIAKHETVRRLAGRLDTGGTVTARGARGSCHSVLAAVLRLHINRPIVLTVAHLDEADEVVDELSALSVDVARFPAMEFIPGESTVSLDLLAERLGLIERLSNDVAPGVIVAPIQALMQGVPDADQLAAMMRVIRRGDTLDANSFLTWLSDSGYTRVETIEAAGEFAVRGGIIDIFPPGAAPVRVDLFGDEVDGLFEVDVETMGSDRRLDEAPIVGASLERLREQSSGHLLPQMLPAETVALLVEVAELTEQGRSYHQRVADDRGVFAVNEIFKALNERCHALAQINQFDAGGEGAQCVDLPAQPLPMFDESASEAVGALGELAEAHHVHVLCQNEGESQRMHELLREFAPQRDVSVDVHYLHRGFIWGDDATGASVALVPYHELLNRYQTRRRVHRVKSERAIDTFIDLQPGDLVVHRDHGIAKFIGLQTLERSASPSDGGRKAASDAADEFLTLEFAHGAKLHVPVTKIHLVQKYVGAFRGTPDLSRIGGKKWKKQKEQVREGVRELAGEMLRIQAARQATAGVQYPADTTWQREFEAEFPYEETEDQLTTIDAIKRDMHDTRPMDRLICGDVGFGKTELAIRATFKAAEFGRQVAVLVPTTVLAEQHERTFKQRFADYPFRIESISRFKSTRQQKETLEALRKGQIDIIIGTHRLLSNDVHFADLGLVVVDEEQRFGVEHKQKLLFLRATVDVITMSATPIPRTLHMSLLGLRDISSLSTAPMDRRAIVTEVMTFDSHRITRAIHRELNREGQVFFVHNRVHNIEAIAQHVQQMAPDARIAIAHGQMPPRQLESVMRRFIRREVDILVCTTIIESGIDIPSANTMFINDADMFGLSELHQLRGRVGRHKHRAYCYLLLSPDKNISEVALKRLRALESFSMLGAGFKIALRDLEIRGAGNLLGAEQSGHISAVGYEMYCQLLEQAVDELKEGRTKPALETTVDIGVSGALPKGYIPSDRWRMDAYRRISMARTQDELDAIEHDLQSAYGEPPRAAQCLLALASIRVAAQHLDVRSVTRHENDIIFRTRRPDLLERAFNDAKGTVRLVGDADDEGLVSVYYRPPKSYFESDSLLAVLRQRLSVVQADDGGQSRITDSVNEVYASNEAG